jgi:hypothetical protein
MTNLKAKELGIGGEICVTFGKYKEFLKCTGKLPINIPEKVEVNCTESDITVKGKFGTLQTKVPVILLLKMVVS